jgi:hypothetical protein
VLQQETPLVSQCELTLDTSEDELTSVATVTAAGLKDGNRCWSDAATVVDATVSRAMVLLLAVVQAIVRRW